MLILLFSFIEFNSPLRCFSTFTFIFLLRFDGNTQQSKHISSIDSCIDAHTKLFHTNIRRREGRKKKTFNCKRGTLLNEQTEKEELMLDVNDSLTNGKVLF